MKRLIALSLLVAACSTGKDAKTETTRKGDRNKVALLNDNTYLLTELSEDADYGYTERKPINVGGVHTKSGPQNQRRFLNALLGPKGEPLTFSRAGSCCPFTTPNGLMSNTGMLDIYIVINPATSDTTALYLNLYDKGELKVPVGFTPKK